MSRRRVRLVAIALFAATVALLLATLEMGFTRDESFYFRYARDYARWFYRLGEADQAAARHEVLGREQVVETWQGNFEHPPLMKTAFGASWRLLARKDRRLVLDPANLSVRGLELHDGFGVGARVALLAPLTGGAPDAPGRVIGRARVTSRGNDRATLELEVGDVESLRETCRGRPGLHEAGVRLTPCQARESRTLALMSESTAMRLPGILSAGLAVALTFLLGEATLGWLAGLIGALAFLFIPRHFFHAHLCCFDVPIVAATLGVLYAFWRARDDRRWALVAGIAWGAALLVKHNAFLLPVPLVAWWLWTSRDQLAIPRIGGSRWLRLPAIPLALLVMPVVAAPMLFCAWPRLWYDPFRSIAAYFQFHLAHDHYMQWYFGQPLEVPPFPVALPFVLTAMTVPEVLLFGLALGAGLLWTRRRSIGPGVSSYLLLNGLLPIVLIALPWTPIFGGVKHWMTGMPLLMIIAGHGLAEVASAAAAPLAGRGRRALAVATILSAALLPPAHASVRHVAYGTGYYNSLIAGGYQGAADRRMMRLYWGHTSLQVLGWLNAHAPTGARVHFQNTTRDAFEMYRRDSRLRHDIRYHGRIEGADLVLIEPQQAFADIDIRVQEATGAAAADHIITWEGVPMMRVYWSERLRVSRAEGKSRPRRGLTQALGEVTEDVDLEHHLPPSRVLGAHLDPERER